MLREAQAVKFLIVIFLLILIPSLEDQDFDRLTRPYRHEMKPLLDMLSNRRLERTQDFLR